MNEPRAPLLSAMPRAPFASASRLPPGRVTLEPVIDGLVADGLLAQDDADRARIGGRATRGLDAVHPLVLLANLKLPSAQTYGRISAWGYVEELWRANGAVDAGGATPPPAPRPPVLPAPVTTDAPRVLPFKRPIAVPGSTSA